MPDFAKGSPQGPCATLRIGALRLMLLASKGSSTVSVDGSPDGYSGSHTTEGLSR